jgi:hypothetical protein
MSKLKAFFGYALAALGLPVVLATFIGQGFWSQSLVDSTGLHVSPWYTGDVVARTVVHADYETRIHKPVFQALIGERPEGFVQVDWAPAGAVPGHLSEEIDYNGDGRPDFRIELNTQTGQAVFTPLSPLAIGLRGTYRLRDAWAVRVDLKNGK